MNNSKQSGKTRRMTGLAIFTAIIVVLQVLCTFIRFGPFSITLALAPIIIGTAIYGKKAGAYLGFVFGLVVLVTGLLGWDGGTVMLLMGINAVGCVLICKMDIRKSVLGSLIMLIVTLLSDLVNFGVLLMMMDQSQISTYLQNEQNKAVSALPGNLVILAVALTLYYVRIRKREAEE